MILTWLYAFQVVVFFIVFLMLLCGLLLFSVVVLGSNHSCLVMH